MGSARPLYPCVFYPVWSWKLAVIEGLESPHGTWLAIALARMDSRAGPNETLLLVKLCRCMLLARRLSRQAKTPRTSLSLHGFAAVEADLIGREKAWMDPCNEPKFKGV